MGLIDMHFKQMAKDCRDSRMPLWNGMHIWQMEGLFTDLVIRCWDRTEFKVHRVIVCPQSKFFWNACRPDSPFKEAKSGVIELTDDEPEVVEAMVSFFYSGKYDYPGLVVREERHSLFDAKCYAIGEKYEIPGLKLSALDRYKVRVNVTVSANGFTEVAKFVYESTPDTDRGLRDLVVAEAKLCLVFYAEEPGFEPAMDAIPGFWKELSRELGGLPQNSAKWYQCPVCNAYFKRLFNKTPYDDEGKEPGCQLSDCCDYGLPFEEWEKHALRPPWDVEGPPPSQSEKKRAVDEDDDGSAPEAARKRQRV